MVKILTHALTIAEFQFVVTEDVQAGKLLMIARLIVLIPHRIFCSLRSTSTLDTLCPDRIVVIVVELREREDTDLTGNIFSGPLFLVRNGHD